LAPTPTPEAMPAAAVLKMDRAADVAREDALLLALDFPDKS